MKLIKPMSAPHTSFIERTWYFALHSLVVLTLLYLVLPVLVVVSLSFSSSTFLSHPIPGYSLRWHQNPVTSGEWRMAAKNNFIAAPAATIVATIPGTPAVIGPNKIDFRDRGSLMTVSVSPMIVPVVVVGVGIYLFFVLLGLANTYTGLIFAHAALGVPLVVTTVLATLQGFNHNLVQAGLSLGANLVVTFFRITLPVIAPGVISGALFAFATSFDEVVVTFSLVGADQATLPCQMLIGIHENISPTIAALVTILTASSMCLLLTFGWLRGRAAAKVVA